MLRMRRADLAIHHEPGVLQRGTSVSETHCATTFCYGRTEVSGETGHTHSNLVVIFRAHQRYSSFALPELTEVLQRPTSATLVE
jgi:hypothetical protein